MKRILHLMVYLYPKPWRDRYGSEFAALLEETSPGLGVLADTLKGALSMHVLRGRFLQVLLAGGILGAILAYGISITLPKSYTSKSSLQVGGIAEPRGMVNTLTERVLSRATLTHMIQDLDLYARERSQKPIEDVVERMRRNIRIESLTDETFSIEYNYEDPSIARRVNQGLVSRFIDENLRQYSSGAAPKDRGGFLRLQTPATLQLTPTFPNWRLITSLGLAGGLVIGAILAYRFRSSTLS